MLESLISQMGISEGASLPPVERWNPPLSGIMDMQVRKDGTWWHEGGQIKRQALVRLFASILKKEEGEFYLVTPVEKWKIQVEDCPLHVLLVEESDGDITAVLSNGQEVILGRGVKLEFSELDGEMLPLLKLASGLTARFKRSSYYSLVEYIEFRNDGVPVVCSSGASFVIPLDEN
ncbi:DUF1285 domain-containing protein [uncultured Thalassolituus sp.]|uniref:DUF1285 domain-containing protein n=1 Tax=uncultured Thalassolituus sp. TaxID=285273 RepID=UPI00261ED20D|nr:DUF1285 domain-containing protein [uncultured Thalassolituus sp.]